MLFNKFNNYKKTILIKWLTNDKIKMWINLKEHKFIILSEADVPEVVDAWEPVNISRSYDLTPPA